MKYGASVMMSGVTSHQGYVWSLTVDPQGDGRTLPGPGHVLCSALIAANISLSHGADHQAVPLQSADTGD